MNTLIGPDDTFALLTILFFAAAIGIIGERKKWYGKISGVIVTITMTIILVSLNVIPSASDPNVTVPLYESMFKYIVPISIPLLLFNVNIRQIAQKSGRLLIAFLGGSAGICLGVIVAYFIVPLGDEAHKIAAVYAATYIGGSVNFIAVADALSFLDSPLFAATIAVDNVFTNLYLMVLFIIPTSKLFLRLIPYPVSQSHEKEEVISNVAEPTSGYDMRMMEEITSVLLIAVLICAVSYAIGPMIQSAIKTDVKLEILIITILVVIAGNLFPRLFQRLEQTAFQMGFFLIYLFLAVIGSACDVKLILASTPALMVFVAISLLVHFVVLIGVCKVMRISLVEMSVASAANVGGSTVSAPMAIALQAKQLVTAAVVIGVLGNVIGTFLGVGIGLLLQ